MVATSTAQDHGDYRTTNPQILENLRARLKQRRTTGRGTKNKILKEQTDSEPAHFNSDAYARENNTGARGRSRRKSRHTFARPVSLPAHLVPEIVAILAEALALDYQAHEKLTVNSPPLSDRKTPLTTMSIEE